MVSYPPCDAHTHTHTPMHTHTHAHTHTHIHTHPCTHSYTHTLIHTHPCTHPYTHTHAHTHTQGDGNKFYLSVNYHEGNSQFSWVRLQGEKALLLTQYLDEAIEELMIHFNKQPLKVPSQQPL